MEETPPVAWGHLAGCSRGDVLTGESFGLVFAEVLR